jgi:ferredoxin
MTGKDERDTMFSRMELIPGSDRYREYYERHPERKAGDDAFRSAKGPWKGEEALRSLVDSTFSLIEDMRPLARRQGQNTEAEKAAGKIDLDQEEATALLQSTAESYGTVVFGAAKLGEACFYTTRGRGDEYGMPVAVPGRYGAVFGVRMRPEEIATAPSVRESAEVVNGYARVALIGLVLARIIRGWGWEASCTMDGRADVVLPVAARYAGLGAIGRSGLLLTEKYGPCIRLGAVVTDFPLKRSARGAADPSRACSSCDRCAAACPAGAIDREAPGKGGFNPVDDDACFAKWREYGTDCGICIAACPLSRIRQGSGGRPA